MYAIYNNALVWIPLPNAQFKLYHGKEINQLTLQYMNSLGSLYCELTWNHEIQKFLIVFFAFSQNNNNNKKKIVKTN
jgi:hypothetical protein